VVRKAFRSARQDSRYPCPRSRQPGEYAQAFGMAGHAARKFHRAGLVGGVARNNLRVRALNCAVSCRSLASEVETARSGASASREHRGYQAPEFVRKLPAALQLDQQALSDDRDRLRAGVLLGHRFLAILLVRAKLSFGCGKGGFERVSFCSMADTCGKGPRSGPQQDWTGDGSCAAGTDSKAFCTPARAESAISAAYSRRFPQRPRGFPERREPCGRRRKRHRSCLERIDARVQFGDPVVGDASDPGPRNDAARMFRQSQNTAMMAVAASAGNRSAAWFVARPVRRHS